MSVRLVDIPKITKLDLEENNMAGMRKQHKAGFANSNFTGKSKSDSKKKQKSTRKQRKMKKYSHVNKYK